MAKKNDLKSRSRTENLRSHWTKEKTCYLPLERQQNEMIFSDAANIEICFD